MISVKAGIFVLFLTAMTTFSGQVQLGQPSAQIAPPVLTTIAARDAATSREDINLTNSCIEAGQSKEHCLCVTKILKFEMPLSEYVAAANRGYENPSSNDLQRRLLDKSGFEQRCKAADAYFDAEER